MIDPVPTEPIALTLLRIQNCLNEYEYVTRRIDAENSFNLLKYYQRYVPADLKFKFVDSKRTRAAWNQSDHQKAKIQQIL